VWVLADKATIILQDNRLVPMVEPEILFDGDHKIDMAFEVTKKFWTKEMPFEEILSNQSMIRLPLINLI